MGQANMFYKLGRASRVPLNTLHFSVYHKLMRESLLLNGGWSVKKLLDDPAVIALSENDFIHYLFLSVVTRRAQAVELAALNKIIAAKGYKNRSHKAMATFDYLSRLPELYGLRKGAEALP